MSDDFLAIDKKLMPIIGFRQKHIFPTFWDSQKTDPFHGKIFEIDFFHRGFVIEIEIQILINSFHEISDELLIIKIVSHNPISRLFTLIPCHSIAIRRIRAPHFRLLLQSFDVFDQLQKLRVQFLPKRSIRDQIIVILLNHRDRCQRYLQSGIDQFLVLFNGHQFFDGFCGRLDLRGNRGGDLSDLDYQLV